ncbi:hypothetical protein E3P88_03869 [Wallemia ichthyophaga]|uniref:Uncharacterized protein n=1 Tax=Wallemia ichthyophaga TaxID=245174 RepID=A0A4T0I1X6_WALIC|nr:hypothetical protein E3P90_03882 [Wallemia ichthyophaga]TIB20575.1 hypothetical protein E3P88_03869 [Wallemia ichthyophaga]
MILATKIMPKAIVFPASNDARKKDKTSRTRQSARASKTQLRQFLKGFPDLAVGTPKRSNSISETLWSSEDSETDIRASSSKIKGNSPMKTRSARKRFEDQNRIMIILANASLLMQPLKMPFITMPKTYGQMHSTFSSPTYKPEIPM